MSAEPGAVAAPEPRPTPAQTRATIKLFWRAAAEFPVRLWLALVTPVLTIFISLFVGPWVIAQLLDKLQAGSLTLDAAWPMILAYAATQLVGQVVGWRIALYCAWSFEVKAMKRLYQRVFDHLASQSVAFHADRFSGSLVSQTNKLTGAFETFWDTVVWQLVPVVTAVVSATVVLGFLLPWYALFLALMSGVFAAFVVLSARKMEQLNVAEAQRSTAMTGFLADVMTNITAVKSAGAEAAESRSARKVALGWHASSLKVMNAFLGYSTGFSLVVALTNTGAVVAAVLASQNNLFAVSTVYLAVTYTITVTEQLWEITSVMRNFNKVMGDAHDMVEILAIPPEVADTTDVQFRRGPGAVRFDRVGFAHQGAGDEPLFEDFDLQIAPGEKLGLVGHSGSGKSTLVRLLLRFADVDAGSISIDGQDLRSVTQASLRREIAYVAQEPLLFHRSIRDNIGYSRPGATFEQIVTAAQRASADDFIRALPQGYDTLVGERGVKLSGGQRQRIAIARAVLADAELLVLDEATSALDSESELLIQAALARAMAGRTTIVIAHRLSTVQAMDRIVVLADGRIVETGSHRQLLASGGVYAELWSHQSGGFLESH